MNDTPEPLAGTPYLLRRIVPDHADVLREDGKVVICVDQLENAAMLARLFAQQAVLLFAQQEALEKAGMA